MSDISTQDIQVVAIKTMSAGNEYAGEVWQETKVVSIDTPLSEIMDWAGSKRQVTLTIPDNSLNAFDDWRTGDLPF